MVSLKKPLSEVRKFAVAAALIIFSLAGMTHTVHAAPLATVSGVSFDGNRITWQALDGAVGYNIYLDSRYTDTVIDTTEYVPRSSGRYVVVAFNSVGMFSPLAVNDGSSTPITNSTLVAGVDTGEPDALQNVFGIVYSSTAGEIFWDKISNRTISYRVSLNGEQVGTTIGTSFWLNTLSTNTQNLVTVSTGGSTNTVPESITFVFNTGSSSFPVLATELEIDPDTTDPVNTDPDYVDPDYTGPVAANAQPRDARLDVYSSTTAELFWRRRVLAEGFITEIYRDDVLLGTTPGNSFYDDTRAHNTRYVYELVVVDPVGGRSESAYINPTAFDDDAETVANTLLTGISNVINDNPHLEWYPFLRDIGFGNVPDDILETSTETFDNDGVILERTVYQCANEDGTLIAERVSGYASSFKLEFTDCDTQRAQLSGIVDIYTEGGLYDVVNYDHLALYAFDLLEMYGTVTISRARATDARTITYTDFEYYVNGFGDGSEEETDTFAVLNQSVAYDAGNEAASSTLDTAFTVNATWTQDRTLTVSTTDIFSANESSGGNYQTGSLVIEAANGERLVLSADTGDDATWYAEVFTTNGSTGVTGDWSDEIQLACIVLNDDCR